jgi:molybdopterin-guanine dinucleotide biosynthesis protein A
MRGYFRELVEPPRLGRALVPRRPGAPRNRAGDEPLHALYHRSCLAPFERRLAQGQRQVVAALAELDVQVFPVDQGDPRLRSFTNVNTPEQLREVRAALGQQPADQEGV